MKKIKKLWFVSAALLVFLGTSVPVNGQQVGIKTNALYWATTTPNLGVEIALGKRVTLDVVGSYNPWILSDRETNKKIQHWIIQPEVRWWTCEKFNRGFFGFHPFYTRYNMGGIDLPLGIFSELKDFRHQGWGIGAGFSYGYQWYLGPHWNLEATFGFGYAYLDYEKFECRRCGESLGKETRHYFGPTRIGVSFIYLFSSQK